MGKNEESLAAQVNEMWITTSGESVPISKMEDNHLINTLRMLKRDGVREAWVNGDEIYTWRRYMSYYAQRKCRYLEDECKFRGICWDAEECTTPQVARTAACATCRLSMVCLTTEFYAIKCRECKTVYVPMGGSVGNVRVPDECPRVAAIRNAVCYKCQGFAGPASKDYDLRYSRRIEG